MITSYIPPITYPIILMAVFARQICLPIPAVLFLISAGALAASGRLNVPGVILIGIIGCLLADFVWFLAGRWWGHRILRTLCAFSTDGHYCAKRARRLFVRWGLPSLTVAKFIPGLDGLMPPLAGAQGIGSGPFLLFDAIGAFLWSAGYCLAGFLFADHLELVTLTLSHVSRILAIALAGILCYFLWRAGELLHVMRELRIRKITAPRLQDKLRAGKRVAVLDLSNFERKEEAHARPGIPGAVRIAPSRLRGPAKVRVPPDIQTVLCCSSPNQLTSARVAVSLRRKGVSNVWVLDGGLKAWQELNLPVTTKLSTPREVAARFGVEPVE
jgi:membrane protein DedA with SNARE-associated domain/rhodanese-related sulfurtransferase